MRLHRDDYRRKVLGCWMGKSIGGTLGAPFEWKRQLNDVSFYTQELTGEPIPNDDLDIQLIWLLALEERGPELDPTLLGEYFLHYVTPHWVEYGMAKLNMSNGLPPPLSGDVNNCYKHSCGAFIRSEIWACVAPGAPALAARYAYYDGTIDHGHQGEGTIAAIFSAAIESAAFVCSDVPALIDIGLSYIPEDSGVAGAIRLARECYQQGQTWQEARDAILAEYRGSAHGGLRECISDDDVAKGFFEGERGWDAPSNLGILVLGLLYGEGDFDKTLCIAVNCGEDTDCTGATIGSLFGILYGIDAIPTKWIDPIGRGIKTACLNLGDLWLGRRLPQTVDEMTDRTERMADLVLRRYRPGVSISDTEPTEPAASPDRLMGKPEAIVNAGNGPCYRYPFFTVQIDYPEGPLAIDLQPVPVRLIVTNTHKTMLNLSVQWFTPEGYHVSPVRGGRVHLPNSAMGKPTVTLDFELSCEEMAESVVQCAMQIAVDGHPTVVHVPIPIVNGNLADW